MTRLHAALDGDGPPPWAYTVARVCEEFACTPSVAMREIARLPVGTLDAILEARHYARAKALVDGATTAAAFRALPNDELIGLAKVLTFERGARRADAHG